MRVSTFSQIQYIHKLIEEQALKNPDKVAIEFKNESLSYQGLNEQSNRLAHYLIGIGVTSETKVGICVCRSLDMIVAILAVLKAGGAYVPIDPDYPVHRIEYIFLDSEILILLMQESIKTKLPTNTKVKKICLDSERPIYLSFPETNPTSFIGTDSMAYLLYTSGSTGNPKGVMITHKNLIASYFSWHNIYQLTSRDRHLQMASFSFDVFSGDLFRALCSGASLVICPKESLLRPDRLYSLLKSKEITCAEFVPAILRRLYNYMLDHKKSLRFLRLLLCGSDTWSLGEYRALKQLCGLNTRIINSYGLTEATIDSTWFEETNNTTNELSQAHYVPIGKPFPHVDIYLLDDKSQLVPSGNIGEIYIGGLGVGRGYYNKPDLTEERFITLKIRNELKRLYKTGDLGKMLPDGNIQFLERTDNQIKLHGIRVELSEIEHAINSYSKIKENAVVLDDYNPEHPRLIAFIVPSEKTEELSIKLRHYLNDHLPHHLIPSMFSEIESMPVTPNNKIDRGMLKQLCVNLHTHLPSETD